MKKNDKGVFLGLNNSGEVVFNPFIKSNACESSFAFGTLGKGKAFRVGELTEEQKKMKTIIDDPKSDYEELERKLGGGK